uniref:Brefeldin A-inhibited guanine nucleotide-exchange protein 3-like n=1 Tax=Phallusia mammillata TaxID=59560 RepID=A0A6F9DG90_9ASCI|nr:brefeldin A-inhibited guanine nucleotide-exchange protein 3-like [Phallusia mammillata]
MDGQSIEKHLKTLLQNTTATRYKLIYDHVQLALDTIETQKVSYAFKAWQIREKCVSVFKEALESNNPALINIGLQAIEYAVFHPDLDGVTGEDEWDAMDARIFVLQVLDALNCLPYLEPEHQVHGLKILLGLCCDFVPSFDGELIIKIVQFCSASCAKQNVNSDVHCAAESLASQAVDKLAQADIKGGMHADKLVDVIGLAKFFLQQVNRSESDSQRALYLECLLSVLKTLKSSFVRKHSMFGNLVRQDLCPTLASVICLSQVGSKTRLMTSKRFLIRKNKENNSKKLMVTRSLMLHRKVALLSIELVRLVGCVASLRPHVAVIFTHLLSSAASSLHGVPYLIMKQLWQKPEILFDLAGPFLIQDVEEKQNAAGILQLIIHAMSQSCNISGDNVQQVTNIQSSVSAVNQLLETLEEAKKGNGLREEQIMHFFQLPITPTLSDEEISDDSSSENLVSATEDQLEEINLSDNKHADKSDQNETQDFDESESLQQKKPPMFKSLSDMHRSYLSEDDDIWMSSEDLRSPASPCYQSAAEGEEPLQMDEVAAKIHKELSSASSTTSTDTATDNESDNGTYHKESDGDIDKYMEEAVSSGGKLNAESLTPSAEEERDRIIARRHIKYIQEILPQLLKSPDIATVDQELQQAASLFCHEIYATWKVECLSVQADSLYILSYATLLLALRLHLNGHYTGSGAHLPCIKSQWVNYQQTSGIYLSKSWLSETFKQIITTDLFAEAGYNISENNPIVPLITTLIEIDGSIKPEHIKLINNSPTSPSSTHQHQAAKTGCEFARQVAVSTWNLILDILQSSFANVQDSSGRISNSLYLVFSPSSLRMRTSREHDIIISSLDGLRCAVKLTCSLGIHSYAGAVLGQMVEACIPHDYLVQYPSKPSTINDGKEGDMLHADHHRLHMCHVLCMDAVIDVALEVGCHSPSRWKSLFRVVSYVSHLESNAYKDQPKGHWCNTMGSPDIDIYALVKENSNDIRWGNLSSGAAQLTSLGFLTQERTIKAIYALSSKIDKMFEQASLKLNLSDIVHFTRQLCQSSHEQLHKSPRNSTKPGPNEMYDTPLLYRLGENMLRCTRSCNRPLLHIGSVWNLSAPHFAKAVGHPNHQIAKQAISYIHDTVSAVLTPNDDRGNHTMSLWGDKEPMYFHLNEALLQPFERAMQLENCDQVIQDQIACSISQLVEASSNRIASGWRPLFSALRNIPFSDHQPLSKSPVLDVLNSFFNASRSPSVFANAAHDCIRCLIKMLTSIQDDDTDSITTDDNHQRSTSTLLCRYIKEIFDILTNMHQNGTHEKFNDATHIDVTPACSGDGFAWKVLTTPLWLSGDVQPVEDAAEELAKVAEECFRNPTDGEDVKNDATTQQRSLLHDSSGLMATWFSLMDGLSTSVLTSSHHTQPIALDLLCKLLEKCWYRPGPAYCLHILLHSCLPTLRSWISRLLYEHDDVSVTSRLASYKHMYGTVMELVAEIIRRHVIRETTRRSNDEKSEDDKVVQISVRNLWVAYLNLCLETIRTRKEHLAKLGCACLRHILATIGNHMTATMITDACRCISYIVDDCLVAINSLVKIYDDRLSDELMVEIQDCQATICDPTCLARVFQSNGFQPKTHGFESHQESHIICDPATANGKNRVSLCEIACDLSSLHLLVKCIEHVMLGESRSPWQREIPYAHHNRQHNNNAEIVADSTSLLHSTTEPQSVDDVSGRLDNQPRARPLPVLLDYLQTSEIHILCACVSKSYIAARNFDRHRDLQRLVQKLGKFYASANLYQFASLTYDTYLRIILALCSHSSSTNSTNISKPPKSSSGSEHPMLLEDLLPKITCVQNGGHLKSASNPGNLDWTLEALNHSLDVISEPWGDVTGKTSPRSPELEPFLMLQDRPWENEEVPPPPPPPGSSEEKSDSGEWEMEEMSCDNMSIDFDYMAYVKRYNDGNVNGHDMAASPQKQLAPPQKPDQSKPSVGRRMYSVASEKTIGRLISAYKKRKQQQEATTVIAQKQTGIRASEVEGHVTRQRSISESSCSVLASDEREVEREAWCNVVEVTLRLLTSAPDHVLTKLLPVVYEPLAALARQQHAVESGSDVGAAFHHWLLRVGGLCNLTNSQ